MPKSALLSIYAARCRGGDGAGLEEILPRARTTYFAFGRQALAEGLSRAGVRGGDRVLLPALICGEVMASLAALGAEARFYAIDETLQVDERSLADADHSQIKAVVAVNYFGFPQPLEGLRRLSREHGALLIEDNAHGFLSNEGCVPLGRRGDLGVFSLRKTLSLPNGAALVDNRKVASTGPALSFRSSPVRQEYRYRVKQGVKRLIELGGLGAGRSLFALLRARRQFASRPTRPADFLPEEGISSLAETLLRRCHLESERKRRRELFEYFNAELKRIPGVRPIFEKLPEHVVPLGCPFFSSRRGSPLFDELWKRFGVPVLEWPDILPAAVGSEIPPHYRQISFVPFLW